jgi:hypothetical protein
MTKPKKKTVTVWLFWTNEWRLRGEVVKYGTRRVAESDRRYILAHGMECGPITRVEVPRE